MKTEWKSEELNKICNVDYGTRVVRKKDGGTKYPVYGGGGATFFMDEFNREDQLTVARFAMSEKCTRFVKNKFFLNDSGLTVRPKDTSKILQKFLDLQFVFLNDYIYSLARGTAQKNLDVPAFRRLKISYPDSIEEQKHIVKILDGVFESISKSVEAAEKNLENAKELFESCLEEVFSNPGEGWEEKKLGEVGKVSMCKRIFKAQTTSKGDVPFYKIGTFGKAPNAFIPNKIYNEYKEKFSFPKKGDILISASGTIGRRVRYDGEPAYFQDSNIVWIDNDEKQVLNDYLYHFYSACKWKTTSKGATISRLYNDNLKQIKFSHPRSTQEQRQLISKIDALSKEIKELETIYKRKIESLDELKKSILKKAFSGELTKE